MADEAARHPAGAGPRPDALPAIGLPPAGVRGGLPGLADAVPDGNEGEPQRLARAAAALDEGQALEIIRVALACDATVATWEELLVPVLSEVGDTYQRTGTAIEAEHLLSSCVTTALTDIWSSVFPAQGQPRVLLACAEDEQHTLPVHALAASLAEDGIASHVLAPGLPCRALRAAIERIEPRAVFVWSQTAATGDPVPLARCAPGPWQLIIGGPGWRQDRVPAGTRLVDKLPAAVTAVRAAVTTSAAARGQGW